MSLNRRRWSNELIDSLMDFQSREGSQAMDSLEDNKTEAFVDSLEDKCTNITSMFATLNLQKSPRVSEVLKESVDESLPSTFSSSDHESVKDRSTNDALNENVSKEEDLSKEDDDVIPPIYDIMNTSMIEDSPQKDHSNATPVQLNHLFNLNERLEKNITLSSDSGTIKCNSSSQNTIEVQSIESQSTQHSEISRDACTFNSIDSNERIADRVTISSDSGTIKLSSCNSSIQNIIVTQSEESQPSQNPIEVSKQGQSSHRVFDSPFEFSKLGAGLIAEMNEPDYWDALIALDEALSPFDENAQSPEEKVQDSPHILTRLSQKFKKTPTRFTEKLVSIIEDSIMSSESPIKPNPDGDTSGISLHRITGEFRKLCKFIEDESMPEWAPSLMNMTSCLEKTQTPEYEKNAFTATPKNMLRHIIETPTQRFSPRTFKSFITPKNKILSNVNTPINRFTPSADKSFEYWEVVCNMICDNANNEKTNIKKTLCMSDSPSVRMNEMLSICERQMASLDDSTNDFRSSEPCKKTDSELKVVQTPRSKSASKIFPNTSEKIKHSSSKKNPESLKKSKDSIINKKELFGNNFKLPEENRETNVHEKEVLEQDFELLKTENSNVNEESFENDFKLLKNNDSKINQKERLKNDFELLKNKGSKLYDEESFNGDYELLKCKDSSMNKEKTFEDDFEPLPCSPNEKQYRGSIEIPYDPNEQDCSLLIELAKRRQRCLDTAKLMLEIEKEDPITNEDSKCLETLYKLGIQDKTLVDVEEDTKFLNTLNHCLEYKNYFKNKSKPIMNMIQKLHSPNDVKNKPLSAIKTKVTSNRPKSSHLNPKHQTSSLKKLSLERKNSQDRKITPRLIPKSLSKQSLPKLERKLSSEVKKMKVTPRTVPKSTSRVTLHPEKKALQPQSQQKKISPKLTPKPALKTPHSDEKPALSKKITPKVTPKVLSKPTTLLVQKQITPKLTPKPSTSKIMVTLEGTDEKCPEVSPVLRENLSLKSPKTKLFFTPGKSPQALTLGRKKPKSYFSDATSQKVTPQKLTFDSVKSPITLYINGTDTDLIQNIHGRINDRLLTPVSSGKIGKSPQFKLKLSSKENKSPVINSGENIFLQPVRYQSAKKVNLIDDKSNYSPSSITPNSRTRKLLKPIENRVVVRHEGRFIDYNPQSDNLTSETSIRVQKVAEKATSIRKHLM